MLFFCNASERAGVFRDQRRGNRAEHHSPEFDLDGNILYKGVQAFARITI